MAAAGKATRKKKLTPAVAAQFARAMDKLGARRAMAFAEIEREKKKREREAAARRASTRKPKQTPPPVGIAPIGSPIGQQ